MHFNVANRKVHYWASFIVAIPILVIIVSGLFLQLKKQWSWVQPPERRGTATVPAISFDQILQGIRTTGLDVAAWDDVDRLDVRPGRGVAKVTLKSGWEVQVDLGTGHVVQTAYRRSDLIESIHDGSFFAGDWTKLGLFLPAGLTLLLLWISGMWMWWVPFAAKRRRKSHRVERRAAVLALVLLPVALIAQAPLSVDPLVGHWESTTENGEVVVIADARKWKTDKATTPFPVAAVRGVAPFANGVLSVRFKMIAGESDQIAGLAFGISDGGRTYYYARYNTKDGNVALWRFEKDRVRVVEGKEHLQLPLNVWHQLRIEIRGDVIVASVNDRLRLEHKLDAPVSGRVGFWTKRDSVTAFKDFTATPAPR